METKFVIQEYLLHNLTSMIYGMVNNGGNHHALQFEVRNGARMLVDSKLDVKEFESEWIFKGMNPSIIFGDNYDAGVLLADDLMKEIIDKLEVHVLHRDNVAKCRVREDDKFKYELLMELDTPAIEFLNNELAVKGIPICNEHIDYDINSTDCDVCLKLSNSAYLLRIKK